MKKFKLIVSILILGTFPIALWLTRYNEDIDPDLIDTGL